MYRCTTGGLRTPGFLLAALLAAGCAARGGGPAPGDDSGYAPGAGYHMIMGEIAAERGFEPTAAEEYLHAAERSEDPEVSQRAAEFAFDNGFDAIALRAARRWSQLAPAEPAAHLYVTRLLIRRNDVAEATAQAEQALGPPAERTAEDYRLLADELAEEDSAEAVTRVMSRILATAPDTATLRLALGAAALRSRDDDLALDCARRALAADPTGDTANEANALMGRALLARGDTDAALAHMAAQAKANPTPETELEYAGLLASADRPEEALAELDDIVARHGSAPAVRRLRALVSLNSDDLKTAWDEFSALAGDGEYTDESYFYMADIAMKQQRFDQALLLLSRVGSGAFLMAAQDAISRIADASGDKDSALQVLLRLAERYPQMRFQVDRYRAALLERQGREQDALDVLNRIVRYRPDDAGLLLARGALLEKTGNVDGAIADMSAAVKIMPDNALALNALGYTLANRTRRHEEAYHLIRRAIERAPASDAILDSYGWVLYRQGHSPEARSYLALAYSQFPDPEVAAHLGEVMWQQGDREPARELWDDALEKDPGSQPLKDTMARFIKQTGD